MTAEPTSQEQGGAQLEVLRPGPLATVQDLGRVGLAHLGVPRAGALDAPAAALANRLVGNEAAAAVVEATLGGLVVRAGADRWVAVTGAAGGVRVAGRAVDSGRAVWLPAGAVLEVGTPVTGVRSYLAVAGGIAVPPVLGSRSTDTLAWVGPERLVEGARLPLGPVEDGAGPTAWADAVARSPAGVLRVRPGPRADWFAPDALADLCRAAYLVLPDSDRVGLRLTGPPPARVCPGELPSEGMVAGAVQVPPDGQPVVFLADHPATGGYPVLAVVDAADLWQCAQLRPGDRVRFSRLPGRRR